MDGLGGGNLVGRPGSRLTGLYCQPGPVGKLPTDYYLNPQALFSPPEFEYDDKHLTVLQAALLPRPNCGVGFLTNRERHGWGAVLFWRAGSAVPVSGRGEDGVLIIGVVAEPGFPEGGSRFLLILSNEN